MKRRIAALLAAAMLAAAAPTLAETMRIGDQAVVKKCKEYIRCAKRITCRRPSLPESRWADR